MDIGRKFVAFLARQSRAATFGLATALMLLVGLLDYLSGYEVSLFIFYAFPILLTVWLCDGKMALLLALLCGITWWWADYLAGHPYDRGWIAIWEPAVRFAFFLFVAVMGSRVRRQHDAVRSKVALLEHSQKLEREIIQVSERERRRIGQDLHDGICQYLAGIGCAATSLKTNLLRKGMSAEAAAAGEISTLLTDGVVQARDLARGLVPVQMDEAGLSSALAELVASVTRLQGVDCRFIQDEPAPAPPPTGANHLYRIAQEAIRNATRHGGARRICVSLEKTGDEPQLRIVDDGSGFSSAARETNGMGLRIMSYRARLIGGRLEVKAREAGGTEVICFFDENAAGEEYVQAA
jgi:signal transduction histidine kinase